jgi:hypothetical protein
MELVQYLEQVAGSKVEEPKPPKPKKTMIKRLQSMTNMFSIKPFHPH